MNNLKKTVKLSAISLALLSTYASADQQILDDLIVDGSICVGLDCVNGESFGFDTLRLKENNLRIGATDTSTSASFPTRDWQITFNDSANGGANKFSIDDIDGGRTPFTIEAGAPSHSLYVDDGGRLGLGTSTPVVQVHVVDGNTPTLRLEQDGSSGFTAQTWDVAGNEANFFVRDATNGSQLPFRIKPGSGNGNALYIDSDGDIGLGTTSPDGSLHVIGNGLLVEDVDTGTGLDSHSGVTDIMSVKTNSHAIVGIDSTLASASLAFSQANSDKWLVSSRANIDVGFTDNRLGIYNEISEEMFTFHQDGSVFIGKGGNTNTTNAIDTATGAYLSLGGTWTNASSRALKQGINQLTANAALTALEGLNPVTYQYKSEPQETYAGFIAEDVPDLVATNNRKSLSPMDIVAVLTKVAQEQQETIKALNIRIQKLEKFES
jgi:hypothetical protein